MNRQLFSSARRLLSQAHKIVILPSSRLDADAIGGALALRAILGKLGKKCVVVYCGPTLGQFACLPGAGEIVIADPLDYNFSPFDLVVLLDGGKVQRFYLEEKHPGDPVDFTGSLKRLVIDHHEPETPRISGLLLSDPEASSTCEMLYSLFSGKISLDTEIATDLLAGIVGDTGFFRFENTTPRVLQIASELLDHGVNLSKLAVDLYDTVPFPVVKFVGQLLGIAQLFAKERYALLPIPLGLITGSGLPAPEIKIATILARDNNLRLSREIDFVVSLREDEPGKISGSLRSRNPGIYDLARLAKLLAPEAGGHKNAAGFVLRGLDLAEGVKLVTAMIQRHLKSARIG